MRKGFWLRVPYPSSTTRKPEDLRGKPVKSLLNTFCTSQSRPSTVPQKPSWQMGIWSTKLQMALLGSPGILSLVAQLPSWQAQPVWIGVKYCILKFMLLRNKRRKTHCQLFKVWENQSLLSQEGARSTSFSFLSPELAVDPGQEDRKRKRCSLFKMKRQSLPGKKYQTIVLNLCLSCRA